MFKKIDHVEIITDDLEQSVDFYTNVLGFTPKLRQHIERSTLGVPLDVVLLDLGGTAVELLSYPGATVQPSPRHPLPLCGINSTVFGKYLLNQPPEPHGASSRALHARESTYVNPIGCVAPTRSASFPTEVNNVLTRFATVAPSPTGEQLGYRMMALEVEDMDRALAYLKTKGVEPSWGPRVTEGQYCRAEIRDPHGHRIELRQWFSPVGALCDRSPREETR